MKILKKCLTCGAEFIASKMSNKYCCRECERDASRKREAKRKKSVRESEKEAALDKERDAVASRPFLTPSDVALLLDMSVSTVYRCFYSGIIKAVRIRRKTLVRREDLDKYFEDAGPYRKRSYKRKQEQEYYTLQEIMDKYKIGRKAVWGRCDRLGIPKVYEGRNTFYSKKLIDANFSELLDVIDIDNYYTLSQIMEMYNMTQGATLCFVKYHAVPRVKRNGRSYYSKVHIDCIKSPFRPFLLSTTSIGQEGLDFHWYARKIVHWNLPSNPVDIEQREGRINRFKCLAIRRNVVKLYGSETYHTWDELFSLAYSNLKGTHSDIVPYWCLPVANLTEEQRAKLEYIERIVPLYPLSRDRYKYERLIKVLALYRMTLGQPRQEELLNLLRNMHLSDKQLKELTIDLCPYNKRK